MNSLFILDVCGSTALISCLNKAQNGSKLQEPNSQHFNFFVTCEWAQ
jgi:hypothetical protein